MRCEARNSRQAIPTKYLPTRNEFLDDAMTKKVHLTRVMWVYLVALVSIYAVHTQPMPADAAGPVQQADFEPDYEASGFVAPAGMQSPERYFQSVQQAGFFGNAPIAAQLGGGQGQGYYASCDTGGCYGGCQDGSCGGGCNCGGGGLFGCGLLGGCGQGGCLANLHRLCPFCAGGGCEVCQSIGRGYLLGALRHLLPYGDAGLSAQRWFDLSADVMFLETSGGGGDQVLATRGVGGTPVLFGRDGNDSGMAVGGRITGAFICGPGGNVEVTYLGGNNWENSAQATGDVDLFSFLSDFGTAPDQGFDDTDRSNVQTVSSKSMFHSGEVNYRRRTVGPYGRFQGSWLGGIRYMRYDSDFGYSALGDNNNAIPPRPRYFELSNSVDNEMVGAQIGGDVWWNVIPGINVGFGMKGGPMGNRIDRRSSVLANSIGPLATPGQSEVNDHISRTAWFGELEATLLYRISHSWTLKTQYYLLNVDHVGFGFDTSAAENLVSGGVTPIAPISTRSLTIRGFSLGAEYIW